MVQHGEYEFRKGSIKRGLNERVIRTQGRREGMVNLKKHMEA